MLGPPPQVAIVRSWDTGPTATVARGLGRDIAPIKSAAERCGFSRAWIWDDGTDAAELWVPKAEVRPRQVACLKRWKLKAGQIDVRWALPGVERPARLRRR